MYLLKKNISEFINDPDKAANEVETNFKINHGYSASVAEINSWKKSYPEISQVLSKIPNNKDFLIYFEFDMPGCSTRADLVIIGLDEDRRRVAIIIELKQWDMSRIVVDGRNVKFGSEIHLQPSEQALTYGEYLKDLSNAFADSNPNIRPYSFIPNSFFNSL